MNIDIRDIITLDDEKDFVIVSKITYENINYYYLININDYSNIFFCYEDKGELVEIEDGLLIKKILPLFINASKNILSEYKTLNNKED